MLALPDAIGIDIDDPIPELTGVTRVIHMGALSSTAETDVERVMEYNYDYSVRLFNLTQKHRIPLQYASSASVYGQTTNPSKESDPCHPQSPYAWSKFFFDHWVQPRLHTAPVQGFRFFNVYDDTDEELESHKTQPSPHTAFRRQAKETGTIKLFEGSDGFVRDFVPVSRVVEILNRFAFYPRSGLWNVGTGIPQSFKSVADTIAAQHSAEVEIIPMPEHLKAQYQKYTCADLTKLNAALKVIT